MVSIINRMVCNMLQIGLVENAPIQFTLGANFSKSTDLNSSYYNRSYMENYYNYMYGVGNYNYNNYENYLDPDKYIQIWGFYAGWGKRLRWPGRLFPVVFTIILPTLYLKELALFLCNV